MPVRAPRRRLVLLTLGLAAIGLTLALYLTGGERPSPRVIFAHPNAEAPESDFAQDLAAAEARAAARQAQEAGRESALEDGEAVSEDDDEILVRVQDVDENPIAGATVRLSFDEEETEKTTGAEGSASFPGPTELTGWFQLFVEAEGFFHVSSYGEYRGEGTEDVVTLGPAVAIAGVVFAAETGLPVPGAEVGFAHDDCCEEPVTVSSDAAGRYELVGLPHKEDLELSVSATGFPRHTRSLLLRGDERPLSVDFHLPSGTRIAGRVIDFESGDPIEGATVRVGESELVTAIDGSFEGPSPFTPYTSQTALRITKEGYCGLQVVANRWEGDLESNLELRLLRTCPIEGVVRDRDGEPVAEAWVSLSRANSRDARSEPTFVQPELPEGWTFIENRSNRGTQTEADGSFLLPGLRAWDMSRRLRAWADGRTSEQVSLAPRVPGETIWQDLVLPDGSGEDTGSVNGIILFAGGSSRGTVRWSGSGKQGQGYFGRSVYSIDGLPAGEVELVVEPRTPWNRDKTTTAPTPDGAVATVQVRAGETTRHDFKLELVMDTISGSVRDATGAALAGRRVDARATSFEWRGSATTDEAGAYVIEVPSYGTYSIWSGYGPGAANRSQVQPGMKGVDFDLTTTGTISIRAIDRETGLAPPYLQISTRPTGSTENFDDENASIDERGRAEIELDTGNYDLVVRSGNNYAAKLIPDVPVVEGGRYERTVELDPGIELRLKLVNETGERIRRLVLYDDRLTNIEGELSSRSWGNSPGVHRIYFSKDTAVLTGLAEASYRIGLESRSKVELRVSPIELHVTRALPQPVTLEIEKVEEEEEEPAPEEGN